MFGMEEGMQEVEQDQNQPKMEALKKLIKEMYGLINDQNMSDDLGGEDAEDLSEAVSGANELLDDSDGLELEENAGLEIEDPLADLEDQEETEMEGDEDGVDDTFKDFMKYGNNNGKPEGKSLSVMSMKMDKKPKNKKSKKGKK